MPSDAKCQVGISYPASETKRGYTISNLLDSSNEESSKKHNRNKKGMQRMGQVKNSWSQ